MPKLNITAGDTVLIHSEVAPNALAETLKTNRDALGPTGTLVVPTFNYGFCSGKPYDHDRTPSDVGLFTEYVRRQPDAVRSLHPIYSFAAIGPQAHALLDGVSHSSFGAGSVFERLLEADAKILFLNCSPERCTFVHYTEQLWNAPYRYLKYFTGQITAAGQTYTDTYDMFVRYLDRDIESSFARLFDGMGTCVRVRDVHERALAGLRRDPWFLLAREPQIERDTIPLIHWPVPQLPFPVAAEWQLSPADMVTQLYPLHRTLASEGTDAALDLVGRELPIEIPMRCEVNRPTSPVWTWRVPERYTVHEAYLETEDGERIADFAANPLHLVSYSPSIDKWLNWEELAPHLHYSEPRPDAIPWVYRYYERDWGFCLPKTRYDTLPRDGRFYAVIRSEYGAASEEGLRLGVAVLPADGLTGEILLLAHICHPMQANDDAAGVAVLVDVARRLAANPLPAPHYGVRFLFVPETIGSVCYLSQHPEVVERLKAGIFVEMAGTDGPIQLQWSKEATTDLDQIAYFGGRDICGANSFRCIICNDEMVVNGPGVNVPCISLSRWPYPEYHTSDDTPGIIRPEKLSEMADVVERIVRIAATNYTPRRLFDGPLCLSSYRLNDPALNHYQKEQIMLRLEGEHSLWQIAQACQQQPPWWATENNVGYWDVRRFVEQIRERGLVEVR